MTDLNEKVAEILIGMPRAEASEILDKVAEAGQDGCFPADVTCEQLGRALRRICMNASEPNQLDAIVAGWRAAEAESETAVQRASALLI